MRKAMQRGGGENGGTAERRNGGRLRNSATETQGRRDFAETAHRPEWLSHSHRGRTDWGQAGETISP